MKYLEWDILTGDFLLMQETLPYNYALNRTMDTAMRETNGLSTRYDVDDLYYLVDNGIIRELYRDSELIYFICEKPSIAELLRLFEETETRLNAEREKNSRLWESGERTFLSGAKIQVLKRRLKVQKGTINFFRSREGLS